MVEPVEQADESDDKSLDGYQTVDEFETTIVEEAVCGTVLPPAILRATVVRSGKAQREGASITR